jgi:catechol 2,3-dioxygenase-like lactoylglutathione lyase family enzyme
MLNQGSVCATIAVKDIEAAKAFYGGTLGLKESDSNPGGVSYSSAEGRIFVYESPNAGTNQATSADWEVEDIEAVVSDLKSKGVEFMRYDMPGTSIENDIHTWGEMKAAWFKDPTGNILGVSSGPKA